MSFPSQIRQKGVLYLFTADEYIADIANGASSATPSPQASLGRRSWTAPHRSSSASSPDSEDSTFTDDSVDTASQFRSHLCERAEASRPDTLGAARQPLTFGIGGHRAFLRMPPVYPRRSPGTGWSTDRPVKTDIATALRKVVENAFPRCCFGLMFGDTLVHGVCGLQTMCLLSLRNFEAHAPLSDSHPDSWRALRAHRCQYVMTVSSWLKRPPARAGRCFMP